MRRVLAAVLALLITSASLAQTPGPFVNQPTRNVPAGQVTGIVAPANGGTGVANNAASTLTISGNFGTTATVTATTAVTLPTTGTLATLAGAEALTNKTDVQSVGPFRYSSGTTTALVQNATATITSLTSAGAYIVTAIGADPNTAWRTAAFVFSSGSALVIASVTSANITVSSSGAAVTLQNTSASTEALQWGIIRLN